MENSKQQDGAIAFDNPEICRAYFGQDNLEDYFYRIEWFFGNNETRSTLPYIFNSTVQIGIQSSGDFSLNNATQNASNIMSVSSLDRTSGSSYSTLITLQQQSSLGSIKLASNNNSQYLTISN